MTEFLCELFKFFISNSNSITRDLLYTISLFNYSTLILLFPICCVSWKYITNSNYSCFCCKSITKNLAWKKIFFLHAMKFLIFYLDFTIFRFFAEMQNSEGVRRFSQYFQRYENIQTSVHGVRKYFGIWILI